MDLRQEVEMLRKVPMFAKLEPSKLKLLAFTSESLTLEHGEVLCHEGDRADCAYVVMDGTVEVLLGREGAEKRVGERGNYDVIGEIGVLLNEPRNATLRAKGAVVVLQVTDEQFLKLVAENVDVALHLIRQLSKRLTEATQKLEKLQRQSANGSSTEGA